MEQDKKPIHFLLRAWEYITNDKPGSLKSEYPVGFTGQGCLWFTTTPPAGWLICDGSLVNKTDYPDLWRLLGDTWGTSTSTQFYLPDLRQRVPVGKHSSGTFSTLNNSGGAESVNLNHAHAIPIGYDSGNVYYWKDGSGLPVFGSAVSGTVSRSLAALAAPGSAPTRFAYTDTQLSSTQSILQPYRVVNFIIKT